MRHIEEYQVKFVAVTTEYSLQQYDNLQTTSYQNDYEHLWSKRYHSRNVTQSQTIRRGVKMDPHKPFLTVSKGVSCCVQGGSTPPDPLPTNAVLYTCDRPMWRNCPLIAERRCCRDAVVDRSKLYFPSCCYSCRSREAFALLISPQFTLPHPPLRYCATFSCLAFSCPAFSAPPTNFFIHITCSRGSVLLWRRSVTLCISGFVGDAI